MPRQWKTGNRPSCINQDGADSALIWYPFAAADTQRNHSQQRLSLVFGLWLVGHNTSFCNRELCILQSVSRGADGRNLLTYSAEDGKQPDGRSEYYLYRWHTHKSQCEQEEVPEATSGEGSQGLCRAASGGGQRRARKAGKETHRGQARR